MMVFDDTIGGNGTHNTGEHHRASTKHFCGYSEDSSDMLVTWSTNVAEETDPTHGHRGMSYILTSRDDVFYAYYFGLLGAFTLINAIGNTAVIASVLRHRSLRTPANYFLFSIACSDLLLGVIYPIYNVSHIDQPGIKRVLGGWMLCTTTLTVYLGLQSISAYSLVGVAVTRFVSIRNPLQFQSIVTKHRVIAALVVIWIGLLLLSGAIYFHSTPYHEYDGVCRYEFVQRNSNLLVTCLISVFFPLLIMTILYCFMTIKARKHVIAMAGSRSSTGSGHSGARRYIIRKEMRMVATTGLLLGYFAFAWTPFVAYEFYTINQCSLDVDREKCEPNRYIRATVRLILHSNSAINFFIYAARLRDFRDVFRNDIRRLSSALCCSRQSQPPNYDSELHRDRQGCDRSARFEEVNAKSQPPSAICVTHPGSCGRSSAAVAAAAGGNDSCPLVAPAVVYSRTMTLGTGDAEQVRIIRVMVQSVTGTGKIITVSGCHPVAST